MFASNAISGDWQEWCFHEQEDKKEKRKMQDTQTLLDGKKTFEFYALAGSGDAKTFRFSLAPEC